MSGNSTRRGFGRRLSAWIEAGRKAGFLVILVAGSAALGLIIALPLWLFATSAREAYTVVVLVSAAAGVVYLVVRSVARRRAAVRDSGRPRRSALAGFLTALMAVIGAAGLYAAAALLARGNWILGSLDLVLWAGILWLLGRGRRAARDRKARPVPAENKGR